MNNPTRIYCTSCGAVLDSEINREYIFCKYCGSKNRLEHETIRTNINVGNINITAKTDLDNLISYTKYLIGTQQYEKADEVLSAAMLSGCDDYRVYICKAMIDLNTGNDQSFFYAMGKLRTLNTTQQDNDVTQAIKELMAYKGDDGITALHVATYNEKIDMVKFCVEHGSDVNAVCGTAEVTPISIMFVPLTEDLQKVDGTTFRDKNTVKIIRNYLLQQGATDKRRISYDWF